jgi:hypothetical protein
MFAANNNVNETGNDVISLIAPCSLPLPLWERSPMSYAKRRVRGVVQHIPISLLKNNYCGYTPLTRHSAPLVATSPTRGEVKIQISGRMPLSLVFLTLCLNLLLMSPTCAKKPQQSNAVEDPASSWGFTYKNCTLGKLQGNFSLPFTLRVKPLITSMCLAAPAQADQDKQQTLIVSGNVHGIETTLRFDWGHETPALAIVKASGGAPGKWWIVFDEGASVYLPNLQERPLPGILSLKEIPVKKGIVLELITTPYQTPFVEKEEATWQISFNPTTLPPFENAPMQLPQSTKEGLIIGLKSPGMEVRFTDPFTGHALVIIPSHQVGFNIPQAQSFPQFHILSSTQGVGFQLLDYDLTIRSTPIQAAVIHPQGLKFSSPQERTQSRTRPMPLSYFADARDLDWEDRKQKINEELMDLPHSQHGPGELELAWLMLSYGKPSEAMGYLTNLAHERPSIANIPLFQMLQGLGYLLLNQLPEAENHLQVVSQEPEVQIWLTLLKALQQPPSFTKNPDVMTQQRAQFQLAKTILQTYPAPLRNQITTLILLAGIATDDMETLSSFIEQETRPQNLGQGEVFDLAKTRVLMTQDKPDAALQMLGELMEKASSPLVRAIARFDYVVYRLNTKMMREEDALPQLENLRLQWHSKWFGRQVAAYLAGREGSRGS